MQINTEGRSGKLNQSSIDSATSKEPKCTFDFFDFFFPLEQHVLLKLHKVISSGFTSPRALLQSGERIK